MLRIKGVSCHEQARKQPKSHAEIVDYFLTTEQGEMEFETARCRPLLTEAFFGYLQAQISASIPYYLPQLATHVALF